MRQRVTRALASGAVARNAPLTDVTGIGPYLEGRLRRALASRRRLTVAAFWAGFRPLSTARAVLVLHRALQNERCNQCVRADYVRPDAREKYHTGDVNQMGYEACAALLDFARARDAAVRYGALPRTLPARSQAAKECGCRRPGECTGICVPSDDGLTCVPRAANARGFVGVDPHPDQSEPAADAARVRRLSRARADLRDRDARRDQRGGHAQSLTYARRRSRLWRRPGSKVRRAVLRA